MKVIIDADSMSYLLGWLVKDFEQTPENYNKVIAYTDNYMGEILVGSKATEYMGFLGGVHPTFRHMMNREYKANRGLTKPDWWNAWGGVINHRLKHFWKFYYIEGIEAEDAVSMIAHHLNYKDTVVAHIDKDLNQIPGVHYNYKTHVSSIIDPDTASKELFKQVLVGDTTDNLPGLPGTGKKGAEDAMSSGNQETDFMMIALYKFTSKLGQREGIIKFAESYAMIKLLDVPPPELGFNPDEYKFQQIPTNEKTDIFTNLTSPGNESGDNSQYFVQQVTAKEDQDKQIPS